MYMMKLPVIRNTTLLPAPNFEDLPEDWVCPICGVGKDQFSEEA